MDLNNLINEQQKVLNDFAENQALNNMSSENG